MNDINACGFKIEIDRQHGSLENNFAAKYVVHNLYTACTFMLPGIRTNTHSLWSYILFAESALTAASKNRLTGVGIFKQLLYQKTQRLLCSHTHFHLHIMRPAVEIEHEWRTVMHEQDMNWVIAILIVSVLVIVSMFSEGAVTHILLTWRPK